MALARRRALDAAARLLRGVRATRARGRARESSAVTGAECARGKATMAVVRGPVNGSGARAGVGAVGARAREMAKFGGASGWAAMRGVSTAALKPLDTFERRHNSANEQEVSEMLKVVGFNSVDALIDATIPRTFAYPR